MATELQKKAVIKLVENGRSVSKAMRDAGYSKNTAVVPQKLTESKGFKELAEPIVEQLKKRRKQAIKQITKKKLKGTSAKDLTDIVDKLTKNIQLLSGKATESFQIAGILDALENEDRPKTKG